MLGHWLTVNPYLAAPHDSLKIQSQPASGELLGNCEASAIPSRSLIVHTAAGLLGQHLQAMRQINWQPVLIVERRPFSAGDVFPDETPAAIDAQHSAPAIGKRIEARHRPDGW